MWPWLFVLILCIICVFYSAIQAVTQKFSIFKEKTVRVIVALYSLHAKILQLGRNWRKWTLFSSLTCETRKSTLEANSWLQWLSKHVCYVQKCRVRFLLCIGRFCSLLQGFLTDFFQQRPFLSIWAKQIGFEYTFFCSMFLTFSGTWTWLQIQLSIWWGGYRKSAVSLWSIKLSKIHELKEHEILLIVSAYTNQVFQYSFVISHSQSILPSSNKQLFIAFFYLKSSCMCTFFYFHSYEAVSIRARGRQFQAL